jgi:hypothetical protein
MLPSVHDSATRRTSKETASVTLSTKTFRVAFCTSAPVRPAGSVERSNLRKLVDVGS